MYANISKKVEKELDNNKFDSDNINSSIIMNSGFAKIYSLLLNDFIIYDGRVGAALGLLVRNYCEEKGIARIPNELLFRWKRGRGTGNRRNPSSKRYVFPELNSSKTHIENNIRANWLLKLISENTNSRFRRIEDNNRMRAIESALFMIGYDVSYKRE